MEEDENGDEEGDDDDDGGDMDFSNSMSVILCVCGVSLPLYMCASTCALSLPLYMCLSACVLNALRVHGGNLHLTVCLSVMCVCVFVCGCCAACCLRSFVFLRSLYS